MTKRRQMTKRTKMTDEELKFFREFKLPSGKRVPDATPKDLVEASSQFERMGKMDLAERMRALAEMALAATKEAIERSKDRTAYHEAGHAVIGRVLFQVCWEATIVPDYERNEAGRTINTHPKVVALIWLESGRRRGDMMTSVMRGQIMAAMAGHAAECEFFGDCDVGDHDKDCYQISCMLKDDLGLAGPLPTAERLEAFTDYLVHRHRDKIARVAALLLERGTLQPDEIDAVVYPVGNPLARATQVVLSRLLAPAGRRRKFE